MKKSSWQTNSIPFLAFLLELFLEDGGQVLGHFEGLNGDADRGDTLGGSPVHSVLGHAILDGDVVRVLRKEVGHGGGVLRLELLNVDLVLLIRHVVAEDLLVVVSNGGERIGAPAAVGSNTDLISVLGLDGELDPVEVGVFLARGAGEGLHGRELLVGGDGFNVVDGHVVKGGEERELVDRHVLKHTLGIALEALTERLGGVLVGVVGYEGDVRSGDGRGELAGLAHVLAHVLVVSHEDYDVGGLGLGGHGLELGNGGRAGLLKVDALGAMLDRLGEEVGVVGGAARDEREARSGGGGRSSSEVANLVPYLDSASACHSLNSGPPGPSPPAPMNQGSTT